jgi:hypothetical protein
VFVADRKDRALDEDDLGAAARALVDSELFIDLAGLGHSSLHLLSEMFGNVHTKEANHRKQKDF